MDIFNHAIAGASTGYYFGKPLEGAILAVLPDLVLGLRRKSIPNFAYRLSHSALVIGGLGVVLGTVFSPVVGAFAVATLGSHLALDIPTHGKVWGTRLLYPLSDGVIGNFKEWEFFNRSWWIGLVVTFIWSALWILAK